MAPQIQGSGLWVPFFRVPDLAIFPPALNPFNQLGRGAGSLLCPRQRPLPQTRSSLRAARVGVVDELANAAEVKMSRYHVVSP